MSNSELHEEVRGRGKTVTVIVNGRPKEVSKEDISFAEVVVLAGFTPSETTIFTVTYRKGEGNKEGMLVDGDSVKAKDGMIFNVTATDKS
jgi:hypothetical protein